MEKLTLKEKFLAGFFVGISILTLGVFTIIAFFGYDLAQNLFK